MAVDSQYITNEQFQTVLKTLNISQGEDDDQELLDRAVGDMESDLAERFVVPLLSKDGSGFDNAKSYAKMKVLNTIKAKIKQLVGVDKNRNVVVDQGQRYIDLHLGEYKRHVETLLDPKKPAEFLLQDFAKGAQEPVQKVGLGRANNRTRQVPDCDAL